MQEEGAWTHWTVWKVLEMKKAPLVEAWTHNLSGEHVSYQLLG